VIVVALDAAERAWMEWALVELSEGPRSAGGAGPAGDLEARAPALLTQGAAGDAGALVVVTGPGSLTGIRIAVAAALGAGMARGIPVHGVGALEVAAFAAPGSEVVAVRPAGRGGLWVGRYRHHGQGLDELEAPVRVDEATWRPPAGVAVGRIPPWPATGSPSPRVGARPLAAAARFAITRPPLDLERVDPATGRVIESRL
jgi:tRNA threonylcarbamoyl adenosine modification protein YeaZ